MAGTDTLPPIPPPFGSNTRNPSSPTRVGNPSEDININPTINVAQNVIDENLPQLLDNRGGFHVTNVLEFDREDFSSWKDRFPVYLDDLEPYLLEILKNGPFMPLSPLSTPTNPLPKPQNQWLYGDRRLANQDKRLKSILISCLPNDGPSETKDTKIAALRLKFNVFKALEGEKVLGTFTRLKCLLNDLENNGVSISQAEGSTSKALVSNSTMQESDSDVEEDQRSSSEFLADLNAEFH
ncbi:hypothetical protein Tco_0126592 [Tanacetum coccineum]